MGRFTASEVVNERVMMLPSFANAVLVLFERIVTVVAVGATVSTTKDETGKVI